MHDDHSSTPPWLLSADTLIDAVEHHLDRAHASAAAMIAVRLAAQLANFRLSRHRVHATLTGLAVDGVPCREMATRTLPVLRALRQAARLVDQLPDGVLRHLAEHEALNLDCVRSGAKATLSRMSAVHNVALIGARVELRPRLHGAELLVTASGGSNGDLGA